MPWNPEKYHQFQAERTAPFEDLLSLVRVQPGLRAVDLGCGTGELTRRLADALPESDLLGLDSSPQMLERAQAWSGRGLRFESGDQSKLTGSYDLIFSNAALQWSEDHAALIPSLFECLNSGPGSLEPRPHLSPGLSRNRRPGAFHPPPAWIQPPVAGSAH